MQPFTPEEWTALRSAAAVAVSKDGASILYRVTHGVAKGADAEEWWTIAPTGERATKLSLPKAFRPDGFMPDGSLYGTYSQQEDRPQMALLARGARSPRVLTDLPNGAGPIAISPDGKQFATLASNAPRDPLREVRTVVENPISMPYVVNADGTGGRWWCPTIRNASEVAWSSDSSALAILSQSPKIGNHYVWTSIDVCREAQAHHVATVRNASSSIAWTDGGNTLAFLSTTTPTLTPEHVYTVGSAGGTPLDRTPRLQGTAVELRGDPSGTIWVLVERGVQGEIDRFAAGALRRAYAFSGGSILGPGPVVSAYSGSAAQPAFTVSDPTHTSNVAVVRNGILTPVTHEGDQTLSHAALGTVDVVRWRGPQTPLSAILTFPPGYVAGKRYPFVMLPHGGPEGNDQLTFDPWTRMIAARGYVVMQPEYRGSTGVNAPFTASIYQHVGDRAYADVQSATDTAIARGWADPRRLAIFGWSAGGFMTAWTVTQTGRYRAAIEGAGITDWLSFVPTSDLAQIDYDARSPISDPNAFLGFSPIMFADRVQTPLLILHGASDLRVPTFQGREYFIFLRELGKTARMVTYPGSPHFPRLWEQRRNVFDEVFRWLALYDPA